MTDLPETMTTSPCRTFRKKTGQNKNLHLRLTARRPSERK
jgi:hypothetical protein